MFEVRSRIITGSVYHLALSRFQQSKKYSGSPGVILAQSQPLYLVENRLPRVPYHLSRHEANASCGLTRYIPQGAVTRFFQISAIDEIYGVAVLTMICFSGKHYAEGMPGSSLKCSRHVVQNVEILASHNFVLIEGLEKLEDATENFPWSRRAGTL
jgi:hypothetical protein